MIKGVNRQVIEISETDCEYFERVMFFVKPEFVNVSEGTISVITLIIFAVLCVLVIAGVVLVQEGQRRIPVQCRNKILHSPYPLWEDPN